jgi:23S rRNA (uracil1939-C5)-methyltransferase
MMNRKHTKAAKAPGTAEVADHAKTVGTVGIPKSAGAARALGTAEPTGAVHAGGTYDVEAIRLNDDGDGVVIVNGLTVFVPNLLISEKASIEIVSVHRRFARGGVIERRTDSPSRVVPKCPVFGICGCTQLQHLDYSAQLQHKEQIVAYALRNLIETDKPRLLPMVGMEYPFRYRNQVQVPCEWDEAEQRMRFGFFARDSHTIVETDASHIEPLTIVETVAQVVKFLTSLGRQACELVHHIIVRESHTTKEQMVVMSVHKDSPLFHKQLPDLLSIPAIVGVGITIQPNRGGPVWGKRVEMLAGQSHIREQLLGVAYLVSPRSFFQVNTVQAEKLYETVLRFANLTGSEHVVDAYCGTGTIALALASHAGSVLGIETIDAAIADARKNAGYNQITNAKFMTGDVEAVLPRIIENGSTFDVIVLDPPRKGVHPDVIHAILATRPKRLIYVSCNPATLGRDAALLAEGGYHLDAVQPVDMFPQTSHVECVSLFVR